MSETIRIPAGQIKPGDRVKVSGLKHGPRTVWSEVVSVETCNPTPLFPGGRDTIVVAKAHLDMKDHRRFGKYWFPSQPIIIKRKEEGR